MRLPAFCRASVADDFARSRFEHRARECERLALFAAICGPGPARERYRSLAQLHAIDAEAIACRAYARRPPADAGLSDSLRWRDLWPFAIAPAIAVTVWLLRTFGVVR